MKLPVFEPMVYRINCLAGVSHHMKSCTPIPLGQTPTRDIGNYLNLLALQRYKIVQRTLQSAEIQVLMLGLFGIQFAIKWQPGMSSWL